LTPPPAALRTQLDLHERLLSNAALVAGLPDGGLRMRAAAAELQRLLKAHPAEGAAAAAAACCHPYCSDADVKGASTRCHGRKSSE
jgi:hypothetical protein